MYSIQVINYLGDGDDMDEVNLIGPYADKQTCDADVKRLSALPGVPGSLVLVWSGLDPRKRYTAFGHRATPDKLANARHLDDIKTGLFGHKPRTN